MALTEADLAEAVAKVGRPRGGKWHIDIDVPKARELRAAGFSWNQIGDYFECSHMTIKRRIVPGYGVARKIARREGREPRDALLPWWPPLIPGMEG